MSANLQIDEQAIRSIVEDVMRGMGRTPATSSAPRRSGGGRRFGVFTDVTEACSEAHAAFVQLRGKGFAGRIRVIEIIKELCTQNAAAWGKYEFEETKIGRLAHKVEKLEIVKHVPGVEWLQPRGMSGDHGITMEEHTPFGVVGAVLPVTHSIPTLSGNVINIVAAGNSVVFNPHPGGARSAALAVRAFNEAIFAELGIENLICTVEQPTFDSFNALTQDEHIALLCVTGGPMVVKAAMASGKRAICAGPGNPPVIVDDTGNIAKAAANVISGSSFDNNLLCIGEKQVFVLEHVADRFMNELASAGGAKLTSTQVDRLSSVAFTDSKDAGGCSHPVLNRELVGADASVLAEHAGAKVAPDTPLLFAETDAEHVFVMEEQMMPMLPIIRVKNFDAAVEAAAKSEHGYKHSCVIHSLNVERMTQMAQALDTTLFVKNGPSTAGLGLGGEGYLSYSIATTTGEGITTPETFTRTRRCVMVDNLRIY